MKFNWSLIFYLLGAVCSIVSLSTGDVMTLAIGLLCAIIAILIERKDHANTSS